MEERDYLYVLAGAPGLSPLLLHRLLSLYGSAGALFRQKKLPVSLGQQEAFARARGEAPRRLQERDKAEKQGIVWVSFGEEGYPARLRRLGDAPLGLFVKGKLPPEETPSVGIVGARSCSPYGRAMSQRFGGELGEQGLAVISGMARGIDGAAQEAALKRGGSSWAVLGCGVDICYPSSHRKLYDALRERGGILSEYPPGTPPLPHHFPLRNRLIAAFSDVLLVLEAREKSGSLITVDQALEQGKDVLALPGRVGDALSAGCLGLIRQGAGLLTCCGDVYETLGISPGDPKTPEGERAIPAGGLPKAHKRIWERLGTDPVHVEALMEQEEMSLGELSLILLELERRGYIRQTPGGGYMKL